MTSSSATSLCLNAFKLESNRLNNSGKYHFPITFDFAIQLSFLRSVFGARGKKQETLLSSRHHSISSPASFHSIKTERIVSLIFAIENEISFIWDLLLSGCDLYRDNYLEIK